MHPKTFTLAVAAIAGLISAQQPHGSEAEDEQGPVGFLWPSDREWNEDIDNSGPCGSTQGPGPRTPFPLGQQ